MVVNFSNLIYLSTSTINSKFSPPTTVSSQEPPYKSTATQNESLQTTTATQNESLQTTTAEPKESLYTSTTSSKESLYTSTTSSKESLYTSTASPKESLYTTTASSKESPYTSTASPKETLHTTTPIPLKTVTPTSSEGQRVFHPQQYHLNPSRLPVLKSELVPNWLRNPNNKFIMNEEDLEEGEIIDEEDDGPNAAPVGTRTNPDSSSVRSRSPYDRARSSLSSRTSSSVRILKNHGYSHRKNNYKSSQRGKYSSSHGERHGSKITRRRHSDRNNDHFLDDENSDRKQSKRARLESIKGRLGSLRSSNQSREYGARANRSSPASRSSKESSGIMTSFTPISPIHSFVGTADATDISDSESVVSVPVVRVSPELIVLEDSDSANGEEDDNFEELQLRRVALEGMLKVSTESDWKLPRVHLPLGDTDLCVEPSSSDKSGSRGCTNFVHSVEDSSIEPINSTRTPDDIRLVQPASHNDWSSSTSTSNSIPLAVSRDETFIEDLRRPPFSLPVQLTGSGIPERHERPIETLLSTRTEQELVSGFHDIDERIIGHPLRSFTSSPLSSSILSDRVAAVMPYIPGLVNSEAGTRSEFDSPHDTFFNQSLNDIYTGHRHTPNRETWPEEIGSFSLERWTPRTLTPSEMWTNQPGPEWINQSLNSGEGVCRTDKFSNPTSSDLITGDFQSNQQWMTTKGPGQQSWASPPQLNWNPKMCSTPITANSTTNSANGSMNQVSIGYSEQFGSLPFPPLPDPVPDPYWNDNFSLESARPLPINTVRSTDSLVGPPLTLGDVSFPSSIEQDSEFLDSRERRHSLEKSADPVASTSSHSRSKARSTNKRRATHTKKVDVAIAKTPDSDCNTISSNRDTQSNPAKPREIHKPTAKKDRPTSTRDPEVDEMRAKLLSDLIEKRTVVVSGLKTTKKPSEANNSVVTAPKRVLSTPNQSSSYSSSHPIMSPLASNPGRQSVVSTLTNSVGDSYSHSSVSESDLSRPANYNRFVSGRTLRPLVSRSVTCARFSRIGNLQITIRNKRIQPVIINTENDSSSSGDERTPNSRAIESRITRFNTDKTSKPVCVTTASKSPPTTTNNEIGQNGNAELVTGSSTSTNSSPTSRSIPRPANFEEQLGLLLKSSREDGYRRVALENENRRKAAELEALNQRKTISRKSSHDLIPSVVRHLPPSKQAEYALLKTKIVEYERAKDNVNISVSSSRQAKTGTSVAKENTAVVTNTKSSAMIPRKSSKNSTPTPSNTQVLNTQNASAQGSEKEIIDSTKNGTQAALCVIVDQTLTNPETPGPRTRSTDNSDICITNSVISNPTPLNNSCQLVDSTPSPSNVTQNEEREIDALNSQIDTLLQSCTSIPILEKSPTTTEEPIIPNVSTPTSVLSPTSSTSTPRSLYNNVVDERQEMYLRQKLIKAALLRKMETSALKLKLAKSENELLNTRATTLQSANTLMEKARRIADNKTIYRNMIARVAEMREKLLKAEQELGLNKLTVQGMISEFTESCKELQGNLEVCEKLSQECREFGTKLDGKSYKPPERGSVEMVTRLKEIQAHADCLKVDSMTGGPTPDYTGRRFGRGRRGSRGRGRGRGPGRGRGIGRPASSSGATSRESNVSQTNSKRNPYPWLTKHTTLASPGEGEEEVYLLPKVDFGNCIGTLVDLEPVQTPFLPSFQSYLTLLPHKEARGIKENTTATNTSTPSIVVRVDPEVTLCTFELQGMCHSEDCTFQHLDRSSPKNLITRTA